MTGTDWMSICYKLYKLYVCRGELCDNQLASVNSSRLFIFVLGANLLLRDFAFYDLIMYEMTITCHYPIVYLLDFMQNIFQQFLYCTSPPISSHLHPSHAPISTFCRHGRIINFCCRLCYSCVVSWVQGASPVLRGFGVVYQLCKCLWNCHTKLLFPA